jgi:D-glycero-alpha-D-manno-heptose 1-phosphate guanylyltransferase
MEAIILAGGLGTRLKSVISEIPKPMAPVKGKPFLEYILSYLKRNDVTRVILSVGYKWELIHEYFGDSFKNMELVYSVENEPLGTGGALKLAFEKVQGEAVYIINGDTFFNISLEKLQLKNGSKVMLSLKEMYDFDRYGCVETDEHGLVTSFCEKEKRKIGYINGGIYLIDKNVFEGYRLNNKFSFEDFLQENLKQLKITASFFDKYFIDIGIPEDYEKSQADMIKYL